jgi:hypothetical protein
LNDDAPNLQAEGATDENRDFKIGAALAYIANMRIFWLLVLGLGMDHTLPCRSRHDYLLLYMLLKGAHQ